MTTGRHALAALVAAALALAAPAAALAQNAGDEQYADPFGKVQNKKQKSGSGTQQRSQGTQQGSSSGQGSSQPSTQSAPTATQTSTAAPAQQTLPRTGAPVGLFAATGAAMLCGGAALRRRVPLG